MTPTTLPERFEGLYLHPYRCPAGVWTIGYGTTRIDGKPVTKDTPPITEEQARALLGLEWMEKERAVKKATTVNLAPGHVESLTDFAYNLGSGAYRASTLRSKLNRGDYDGAAAEFPKWKYGGGRVLPGLVLRREAERLKFERATLDLI